MPLPLSQEARLVAQSGWFYFLEHVHDCLANILDCHCHCHCHVWYVVVFSSSFMQSCNTMQGAHWWQICLSKTIHMLLLLQFHTYSCAMQCKVCSVVAYYLSYILRMVLLHNHTCSRSTLQGAQWWHLCLSIILHMFLFQNHTCSCAIQCKVLIGIYLKVHVMFTSWKLL